MKSFREYLENQSTIGYIPAVTPQGEDFEKVINALAGPFAQNIAEKLLDQNNQVLTPAVISDILRIIQDHLQANRNYNPNNTANLITKLWHSTDKTTFGNTGSET
jgi:hypothetical protein